MSTVNLTPNKEERALITEIENRFFENYDGPQYDRLGLMMDITACHLNGCPLDLQKLAQAGRGDFAHDVAGIHNHIDRKTGKLTGCFLPRCAMPERRPGWRKELEASGQVKPEADHGRPPKTMGASESPRPASPGGPTP